MDNIEIKFERFWRDDVVPNHPSIKKFSPDGQLFIKWLCQFAFIKGMEIGSDESTRLATRAFVKIEKDLKPLGVHLLGLAAMLEEINKDKK